jgi:hypothetical protein
VSCVVARTHPEKAETEPASCPPQLPAVCEPRELLQPVTPPSLALVAAHPPAQRSELVPPTHLHSEATPSPGLDEAVARTSAGLPRVAHIPARAEAAGPPVDASMARPTRPPNVCPGCALVTRGRFCAECGHAFGSAPVVPKSVGAPTALQQFDRASRGLHYLIAIHDHCSLSSPGDGPERAGGGPSRGSQPKISH